MTGSLGYKRNTKRTETNVIGDVFPLTNFCRERWCHQINVPGIFLFRCIFLGQCTLRLIILSLRRMRRAGSIPIDLRELPGYQYDPNDALIWFRPKRVLESENANEHHRAKKRAQASLMQL